MTIRRFTSELRASRAAGDSLEESLSKLRSQGASIMECIVSMKEETGCSLGDAKEVVAQSKTWSDVTKATEPLWDELIAGLEKEEPNRVGGGN
ncbi:MAG: hypothetical protein SynsKO_44850 [Synoicihabitans sp.]